MHINNTIIQAVDITLLVKKTGLAVYTFALCVGSPAGYSCDSRDMCSLLPTRVCLQPHYFD